MHEIEKYGEARFFLAKMQEEKDDLLHLSYYLSAFMSAGRSVLQYALEEIKQLDKLNQKRGRAWYDNKMATNQTLQYFKTKRDVSIHQGPVQPKVDFQPSQTTSFPEYDSTNLYLFMETSPDLEKKIKFPDWAGDEDIFAVCEKYLTELALFATEGKEKGFLAG